MPARNRVPRYNPGTLFTDYTEHLVYTFKGQRRRSGVPWKECDVVSERMKFIASLQSGNSMAEACREFGITRPTGYKFWERYKQEGLDSLKDRISAPWRVANKTPQKTEALILEAKELHPTWGAAKILAHLARKNKSLKLPVESTVHAILDRNGKVKKQLRRRGYRAIGTNLTEAKSANELWCADFKGQFKMGNGKYCYPLTITDQHSRYLLACEGLEDVREKAALETFKYVFDEYGLPDAIRTDNGVPFAARSLFGLSKLSVMWLRLGIRLERIEPGHPEQNGRHERMHRTLKLSVTKPPAQNFLQQQELFDDFKMVYNNERPHEALKMKTPSDIYVVSKKRLPITTFEDIDYSDSKFVARVSKCGCIRVNGSNKMFISDVFAGQYVGIKEVDDRIWSVNFMEHEIGFFDFTSQKFSPATNPFLILNS
jgi:transposase InsO family protein